MNASHDEACARVAAQFRPRWLRHYAASKLRHDEVFRATFEVLHQSNGPIFDVGCGIGLLPFYLRERGLRQPMIALDFDAQKLAHAREVAHRYDDIEFVEQDAATTLPSFSGNITIFDMLHYLPPARRRDLLDAAALRLAPKGTLLIRECPNDSSPRFWATYFAERFAQAISWNPRVRLHFPTREEFDAKFNSIDFVANEQPMYGYGPFNNRLFTIRRRPPAIARARESRSDNHDSLGAAASAQRSGY